MIVSIVHCLLLKVLLLTSGTLMSLKIRWTRRFILLLLFLIEAKHLGLNDVVHDVVQLLLAV